MAIRKHVTIIVLWCAAETEYYTRNNSRKYCLDKGFGFSLKVRIFARHYNLFSMIKKLRQNFHGIFPSAKRDLGQFLYEIHFV